MRQRFPDSEHIIVDGGSTDRTPDIFKKYRKHIQVYRHKGEDQVHAINWGLARATGDVVCYINADDYYLPGAFYRVAEIFSHDPRVQWITGDYTIVNARGKPVHRAVPVYKKIVRSTRSFVSLLTLNYIAQPSTFWTKRAMKHIGYFDTSLRFAFDYDYWLRMIRKYPLYVAPEQLSAFRIHQRAKGSVAYPAQFKEDLEVAARYSNNAGVTLVHRMHNQMIVWMYNRIKK